MTATRARRHDRRPRTRSAGLVAGRAVRVGRALQPVLTAFGRDDSLAELARQAAGFAADPPVVAITAVAAAYGSDPVGHSCTPDRAGHPRPPERRDHRRRTGRCRTRHPDRPSPSPTSTRRIPVVTFTAGREFRRAERATGAAAVLGRRLRLARSGLRAGRAGRRAARPSQRRGRRAGQDLRQQVPHRRLHPVAGRRAHRLRPGGRPAGRAECVAAGRDDPVQPQDVDHDVRRLPVASVAAAHLPLRRPTGRRPGVPHEPQRQDGDRPRPAADDDVHERRHRGDHRRLPGPVQRLADADRPGADGPLRARRPAGVEAAGADRP